MEMVRLVPLQSQVAELLDEGVTDEQLLRDNLQDMARANRWLGTNRAVQRRVAAWLEGLPAGYVPRILDVATGGGDLPIHLWRWSIVEGRSLQLFASDVSAEVLRVTQTTTQSLPVSLIRHDAQALPFANESVDIVTCTQALHHFGRETIVGLLHEWARVARLGVIVNDLRRSYPAYWGARILAHGPVSPLSRHDGPLSVLRAYTPLELRTLLQDTALPVRVRRASGFRLEIELDKSLSQQDAGVHEKSARGSNKRFEPNGNKTSKASSKGRANGDNAANG